ncbi:hypothetical protein DFH06DRAFT_1327261 [Mycena polygramma]|nr:hypothetical protein DFH06DRAFT_1327261 [Mycena polygramma]
METILAFHSTCVMNVLTYNRAYALYLRSTFIHKEALVIKTAGAGQEAGRKKYVDRGWKMTGLPSLDDESEVGVRLVRWPGDRFTWTVSLPEITLRSTDLDPVEPTDLCTTNSWQLDFCSGVVITKWVRIENASLRYKYIVADSDIVWLLRLDTFCTATFLTPGPDRFPHISSRSPAQSNMDVALCRAITRHRAG